MGASDTRVSPIARWVRTTMAEHRHHRRDATLALVLSAIDPLSNASSAITDQDSTEHGDQSKKTDASPTSVYGQ